MPDQRSTGFGAWQNTNPNTPLRDRLLDLKRLIDDGSVTVDECQCAFGCPYGRAVTDDLDESALRSEVEVFLDAEALEKALRIGRRPKSEELELSNFVARLLTGFSDWECNEWTFPTLWQILTPLRELHVLSYVPPPDQINAQAVIEDLDLILEFSDQLSAAELREASALKNTLMGERQPACRCFPGNRATATAEELRTWASGQLLTWGHENVDDARASLTEATRWRAKTPLFAECVEQEWRHEIKQLEAGLARPGTPRTDVRDEAAAGVVAFHLPTQGGLEYPNTSRAVERWRNLSVTERQESPQALYEHLLEGPR
jgi:hypothetical protein